MLEAGFAIPLGGLRWNCTGHGEGEVYAKAVQSIVPPLPPSVAMGAMPNRHHDLVVVAVYCIARLYHRPLEQYHITHNTHNVSSVRNATTSS